MKKCLNCENEVRPSVVKCPHCGQNPNTPKEGAPPVGSPAASPSAAPPPTPGAAAPVGASEAGSQPVRPDAVSAPPASVAFSIPGQTPSAPPGVPDPEVEAPEPVVGEAAAPAKVQDWGAPVSETRDMQTYWGVKREPPTQGTSPEVAKQQFKAASGGNRGMAAALLVMLGGALAAFGALQPWFTLEAQGIPIMADFTQSAKGTEGWEGQLCLILGGLSVLFGIIWFGAGRDTRRLKGALFDGVVITGVSIYTLATLGSQLTDGAVQALAITGLTESAARGKVQGWESAGKLSVTTDMGLYMCLAGGLIILVGAIVAFTATGKAKAKGPASTQDGGF